MNENQILVFFNQVKGKKIKFTGWGNFPHKGNYFIPDKLTGRTMSGMYYNTEKDSSNYMSGWGFGGGLESDPKHKYHWEFFDDKENDHGKYSLGVANWKKHKEIDKLDQVITLKYADMEKGSNNSYILTVKGGNIAVKHGIHIDEMPEKIWLQEYKWAMKNHDHCPLTKHVISVLKSSSENYNTYMYMAVAVVDKPNQVITLKEFINYVEGKESTGSWVLTGKGTSLIVYYGTLHMNINILPERVYEEDYNDVIIGQGNKYSAKDALIMLNKSYKRVRIDNSQFPEIDMEDNKEITQIENTKNKCDCNMESLLMVGCKCGGK